ncbi:MAG: type II secretion system protein N [Pseudomonadota bacterium]
MQGFTGSVWRGEASRCMLNTPAGMLHLGAVRWRLNPFSLLLLSPKLRLESNWGNQKVSGDVTLRGSQDVDLRNLEAVVSAGLVRQFAPIELAGQVQVQADTLSLRDGLPVSGEGRIVWMNAAWLSPTGPMALGSYALDFSQDPAGFISGDVITLSGNVNAEGIATLDGNAYSVDITLTSEAGMDSRLRQALSLMARPVPNGFQVSLNGDL